MNTSDLRRYLEREIAARASHESAEHVRTTCSFARAERLLGREYHGRFLIELLQNAADASRSFDGKSARSSVVVRIAEGPALLVANQGSPMGAEVVVESLGHIGASTKAEGEAIGHKGIGFKSVLELTLTPEIYSGLQQASHSLSVGFDPEIAADRIRSATLDWDEKVRGIHGLDPNDPYASVPVLRFPYWVEEPPQDVTELKERGFDTVVRLPFDARFADRLGLDEGRWLQTVREACNDVSDRILLLLGCFDKVHIEDRLDPSRDVVITPDWEQQPSAVGRGITREVVRVRRNRDLSSRWRLFRRELPDRKGLEGEIAVGIRVDGGPTESVLPAVEDHPSSPFHLFFPTRIYSGLPFLLHAYFEVDAARAGFYQGSVERNETMLAELADLARLAVADAAADESIDLVSLVALVARAGDPEDDLARKFRCDLLALLDDVPWIPLQGGDGVPRGDRPANVLGARSRLVERIGSAFPTPYIRRRTDLGLPDLGLSDAALDLVMDRPSNSSDLWATIRKLCLPGDDLPWHGNAADQGFRSLVDLFAALDAENRPAAQELLDDLRGNSDSRLVPTVGEGDSRVLLPIPDPRESVRGRRGRLVMARVGRSDGPPLVPPERLDVAFLPDGLLSGDIDSGDSGETAIDRARPLGIRPFTADDVLDRLNVVEEATPDEEHMKQLVSFLWRLLVRARGSALGTKNSAEEAATFDPSKWFWCSPGSVWQDPSARPRQQRERRLAAVLLPCRDGRWRSAGHIAFGEDWARWLEDRADGDLTAPDRQRVEAYDALEQISPGERALLAPPDEVLNLLGDDAFDALRRTTDSGEAPDESLGEAQQDRERHAFLLRLGVWEVPPIEAFQNGTLGNRDSDPWAGPTADTQRQLIEEQGGWRFGLHGWSGNRHHQIYLAEDYRFLWPLKAMAQRNPSALVKGLRLGVRLYGERSNSLVFCSGCSDGGGSHRRAWRHSTGADGYPSQLAVQLRSEPWVPCTVVGEQLTDGTKPSNAWWHPKPPSGAGMLQSPWRLVPLCGPDRGIDENLRRLSEIRTLEGAAPEVVEDLLRDLRERYHQQRLPDDPRASGNARQAFVGLHRLAYERLAELPKEAAATVIEETGVLCEVGEKLEYRGTVEARHDDGSFATYVRHFVGRIPFTVIPRDRASVASHLGIPRFELTLERRGEDEGRDVTDDIREFLGDRVHELLSIMVHHSLGAQTLDAQSEQFEDRARRIRNLKIRYVRDLIIDIVVPGPDLRVTVGEGSTHDLFLEGETTSSPVLYHDFAGDGWEDRLRRKISPYIARVLGNPAYSHTFAQFLQGDDAEREEFLLELGISQGEADAVRAHIGVVGEEERLLYRRWFAAILGTQNAESVDLDPKNLTRHLKDGSLPAGVPERLVELGGGRSVRRDTGPNSALRLLEEADIDLRRLQERLHSLGDPGLDIRVSRTRFSRWIDQNRLRLRAVLETKCSPESAKAKADHLQVPSRFDLALDPALPELLSAVVEVLHEEELHADADRLANAPAQEFVRLGSFQSADELDEKVNLLLSDADRARFLSGRAARWREEIRRLAVLVSIGSEETTTNIRKRDEEVDKKLPGNPASPPELRTAVEALFDPELAAYINDKLVATINAPTPDPKDLIERAGIDANRIERVHRALDLPRHQRARRLDNDRQSLRQQEIRPTVPAGLRPPPVPEGKEKREPARDRKVVKAILVDERHDQRKRELGDEGEWWALAAVIDALMDLSDEARDAAIGGIEALLKEQFEGKPVDRALAHAGRARLNGLDDEERIEELSGLLHVSRYSDAFGFDMVGWLPTDPDGQAQAICLEVKNSSGGAFQFSRGEWSLAKKFDKDRRGDQYAILVVRRAKAGGVPDRMDLLSNPRALVKSKLLKIAPDGYQMTYHAEGPSRPR